MSAECPMFPLGSVLLPTEVLPLHVFEPRYREMTRRCLAGDRTFGVVLIERGSEVGGGDTRSDVATLARIIDSHEFEDGRWALAVSGMSRLVVDEWLPDDPYPRALVHELDDGGCETDADFDARLDTGRAKLLAIYAAARRRGADIDDPVVELAADPSLASFQLAASCPIGPYDRYRILTSPTARGRLDQTIELLDAQLALMDDEPPSS